MKKTLMMATGALVAAGFAADARAVDVELYGQVNKSLVSVDNGTDSEVSIADNDMAATRIGVKGEQQLANGLTASVLLEFQSENNTSSALGAANNHDGSGYSSEEGESFKERHSRVGLAGNFGAIFLGNTSTAADGIAEIDIAGVEDVMSADISAIGGGAILDGSTTLADAGEIAFDDSRTNVAVYHSPVVNGFQVALSADDATNNEVAVRYSGKYDALAVKAGVGYRAVNDALQDDAEGVMAAAVTVKHDNGLGATLSYSETEYEDSARNEGTNFYAKVGYTMDMLEFAADYSIAEDVAQNGDELTSYGVGAQYNLGDGVSVAAVYRTAELDRTGSTTEQDIDIMAANLRVKF